MKSLFFRWYLSVMKFLAGLMPTKKNAAVILNGAGRSGSNGYIFYKYLQKNYPHLDVTLVEPWPSSHLPFSTWKKIGAAKYVFTTHQPFKIKSSQIDVEFWHGIPLKRMGTMANNTLRKDNQRNEKLWHIAADVVTSSSDLYETLMSACMGIETYKYHKLGFPRLDVLKKPIISKQKFLQDLFKTNDSQAKIGIYMPTFRYELEDQSIMKQIEDGNFFVFKDFDVEKLNNALKKKHQYLIVKLHPYEMKLFANFDSKFANIAFMNNDYLFDNDYDLYELLGLTDFLITDFSSIYFDYLHLNKPILFITNFLKQYEKTRGLLMGPYKEIAPGECINSQAELENALNNLNNSKVTEKRQYWLSLTNQLGNDKNCRRVCEFLKLGEVK